jgi:hypothetical protein
MTFWSCFLPDGARHVLARLLIATAVISCAAASSSPLSQWWQPEVTDSLQWQLQLQGDLVPIAGVNVYAVDADASVESVQNAQRQGAKVMCYISAGSAENWRNDYQQFPDALIGRPYDGWPGEWWLDIRRLDLLAPIMRARIQACRRKGFDVLDPDNINGYENETGFPLTRADAVRYIRWLAAEAHRNGMAISLKNGEDLIDQVADVVDMMQSESCYFYGNCDKVKVITELGKPVFAVEYLEQISKTEFAAEACEAAKQYKLSMILRARSLRPDSPYYACAR